MTHDEALARVAELERELESARHLATVADRFHDVAVRERDLARVQLARAVEEVSHLRGILPELPPRPSDPTRGGALVRYGIRWNGPTEPICTPMPDGYWTPWHIADQALRAARGER